MKELRNNRDSHQAMIDSIHQAANTEFNSNVEHITNTGAVKQTDLFQENAYGVTLSDWDQMDAVSRQDIAQFTATTRKFRSYSDYQAEFDQKRRNRTAIIDGICWVAGLILLALMLTSNVWLPALIPGFN